MLGAVMFCSKILMELLPNIHLVGMLTMTYTVVYRTKALIPVYIYVVLNGLFEGFNVWWVPTLYIWTVLWAVTMLLPKSMPKKVKMFVYPALCGLHGLLYGTLYAPVFALLMHMDIKATGAWIIAGLGFDAIHACGNLVLGCFILPLSELLGKLEKVTLPSKKTDA